MSKTSFSNSALSTSQRSKTDDNSININKAHGRFAMGYACYCICLLCFAAPKIIHFNEFAARKPGFLRRKSDKMALK